MAKKKGIFGKIVKGALMAGGSILGIGIAARVAKGAVKGTGLLARLGGGGAIKRKRNALKENARGLLTGLTKEERVLINQQKDEARDDAGKLNAMEKLISAGATPAEARAKLGLAPEEVPAIEGEVIQEAPALIPATGTNKVLIYAGVGLLALFLVPMLFKKR